MTVWLLDQHQQPDHAMVAIRNLRRLVVALIFFVENCLSHYFPGGKFYRKLCDILEQIKFETVTFSRKLGWTSLKVCD